VSIGVTDTVTGESVGTSCTPCDGVFDDVTICVCSGVVEVEAVRTLCDCAGNGIVSVSCWVFEASAV